jgi:carboxyl-terminal processing protease
MMHKLKLAFFLALVPIALFGQPRDVGAQLGDLQLSLTCRALPMVSDGLMRSHVSGEKADNGFAREVAELWAERIDPTETLLTEAEYQQLEKRLYRLVKSARKGECADFTALKKDHVEWQKELEDHVRKVVKNATIDKSRTLNLDPDKRPRPTNEKEQNQLRRALIDLQLANYIASGIKEAEARKKLVHRYELRTKRIEEQTPQDLYGLFLKSYAAALDPHSTYFTPEDVEDFKIQMQLSLQGIGAMLSSRDGMTVVEEIVPGGAADEHGKLKPKDQIISVAQGPDAEAVNVIDMDLRDVVRMIRGKKGTKVTLTVLRKGEDTTRHKFTIVRDKIDLKEQAAKLEWRKVKRGDKTLKLAVIELPSFYHGDDRDSVRDVAKLLKKARKGKADGIMLDLSRNGGGLLKAAVEISGLFVETGGIVGVGSANGKKKPEVLEDPDSRVQWDGPLVVLTSKISASASEILAGSLQDYRRAIVVGDKHTYGKGSVQQLNQLPPGLGLLKVTTALYFLPGGQSTQSTGVTADIEIPSAFSKLEIGERHQPNALAPVSTKSFVSKKANASKKWEPVDAKTIGKLRKKSKARIASDAEFKELQKKIAESDPEDTEVEIAEILGESNGEDSEDAEEEKDEDELTLQAIEATEILADLIAQ